MTFTARGLYASSSKAPRDRRGRGWLIVGACIGLAALGVGALGALNTVATTTSTETQEFPASAVLEIDNQTEGGVTVVVGDDDTVTVEMRMWSSMTAVAGQKAQTQGDRLRLAARCGSALVFGRCAVDYKVTVPEGTEVSVVALTGDVQVTGVSAPVDVTTDTGAIQVADVEGGITLESDTGNITAEGSGPSAVATSDTGTVDLSGFEAAEVRATTAVGDIWIGSGFETATVRSDTGSVRVDTDTEFRTLTATTDIGDIELRVPDTDYRVIARTDIGAENIAVDQSSGAEPCIEARSDTGSITVLPQ
ncbi:DUF4097 family beta strand repeat-containing protein [Thermobifida cellulosilytica]|uniref:DUF4097 domain-containing protein n=1 Tax=Thermobifida cellulosilytica TB100 TaxID=665004 RepID=A0A147KGA5_THECS|nr:DUF4097 family beta strand repeat-containing protein [Thermobifida cellulosilytica]KUP96345.1 hypothetical protein AC529_12510 [Thermobifida cellulosilytica TB100]